MAPATLAGTVDGQQQARTGRDRDFIINAIQEWVATYGEPPRAADWNPSSAKWSRQLWRVERYRAGRADGTPWPALNTAKRPFGGSLTAAIRAAGFEPAKPGPRRRSEVDPEQAGRAVMTPEGRLARADLDVPPPGREMAPAAARCTGTRTDFRPTLSHHPGDALASLTSRTLQVVGSARSHPPQGVR